MSNKSSKMKKMKAEEKIKKEKYQEPKSRKK